MKKYRISWEHVQLGSTVVTAESEKVAMQIASGEKVNVFETVKDTDWIIIGVYNIE